MWVTKECWLGQLRLEEVPAVNCSESDKIFYGFEPHYWEEVSCYDWHRRNAFGPHYFGVILVCDSQTGLPRRELSIITPDTPDFAGDGLELAEFRYYLTRYYHVLLNTLTPARLMETRIFWRNKDGVWTPANLRRNVHTLADETDWQGPKQLGCVLEVSNLIPSRRGNWVENYRTIYAGNDLDFDSEAITYFGDNQGNLTDPVYKEGDDGSSWDLAQIPHTLGKARVIKF